MHFFSRGSEKSSSHSPLESAWLYLCEDPKAISEIEAMPFLSCVEHLLQEIVKHEDPLVLFIVNVYVISVVSLQQL